MTERGCFRCNTGAHRSVETPRNWSEPRALCLSHKVDLEMEDGQRLDVVLSRVAPPDHPLEGSLLARIFNPVVMEIGAHRGRGWVDFAAGGMAVFEDRFHARSYFEFHAFEAPGAVDVLYAVRRTVAAGSSVVTMVDVLDAIVEAERAEPRDERGRLRAQRGFGALIPIWTFQDRLDRVRATLSRLWPGSFEELGHWIEECGVDGETLNPSAEAPFVRVLNDLALRRFQ